MAPEAITWHGCCVPLRIAMRSLRWNITLPASIESPPQNFDDKLRWKQWPVSQCWMLGHDASTGHETGGSSHSAKLRRNVHCRKWQKIRWGPVSWWDCMQANVSHEFALREHSLDILSRRIISNKFIGIASDFMLWRIMPHPTHACAILTRVHVHIPWCHNCPLELPTLLFASLVLCRHLQEISIATKRWSNYIIKFRMYTYDTIDSIIDEYI